MSNIYEVSEKEREVLRRLASQWMEFASLPIMKVRKRQWKAVKDLKQEKPMLLLETWSYIDYVKPEELQCKNQFLRDIEKFMLETVRHVQEIPDDIVVEPYFRIPWLIELSTYGVQLEKHSGEASDGSTFAFKFDTPINKPEDIDKLKPCIRKVERDKTIQQKEFLDSIIGDIIPIVIGGFDWLTPNGYSTWLGNIHIPLTYDLFRLIGYDNLLLWLYDYPDIIHNLMSFLRDEWKTHLDFLEQEKLLYVNTDTWNPCPCSYGYVSDLPSKGYDGVNTRIGDCWLWAESQEAIGVSPNMYNEFFLPYIADAVAKGGLVYYGCCEPIHDRLDYIIKAIPNLRAVSVSGWSDVFKVAEIIGKNYVFSRKPMPAFISGEYPDWDQVEKDLKDTFMAAKNCNLELCFRNIHTTNGDRGRLARWAEMANRMIDAY